MSRLEVESDEALMLAFAKGDARAFEVVFDRHRGWLLRMLRGKLSAIEHSRQGSVSASELAEDIAQDTWLTIVRTSAQYQPNAKFTTWLFRLAQQRLVDELRKIKPTYTMPIYVENDDDQFQGSATVDQVEADSSFDPAAISARKQLCEHLVKALEALPLEQREVFVLTAEAGLSVPEAAAELGWPLEAAKSRLRYARAKLVAALKGKWP